MCARSSALRSSYLRAAGDDLALVVEVVADAARGATACAARRRRARPCCSRRSSGARVCLKSLFSATCGHRVALQLDLDPHARLVGVVGEVGDLGEHLVVDEIGDLLDHAVVAALLHAVGELGDDDRAACRRAAPRCGPARASRSRPRPVRYASRIPLAADDDRAGREVRALDVLHQLVDVGRRGRRSARRSRRSTSPRLCGGMFVAIPTAIPAEPLTSRFGNRAGSTVGSLARLVVVRLEVDGVGVDVAQELGRELRRGGTRCSASPPAGRRRASRSCPGRRRAGSAARTAARAGRACRRSPSRRAGGTCPSRRRRSRAHFTYGRFGCSPVLVHRVEDAPVHGLQAVAHVGERARDDHATSRSRGSSSASPARARAARSGRRRGFSRPRSSTLRHPGTSRPSRSAR